MARGPLSGCQNWPSPAPDHWFSTMQQQSDYVLRTVEERGVRFVHLWFTDVLGSLKSFAITPRLVFEYDVWLTIGSAADMRSRFKALATGTKP